MARSKRKKPATRRRRSADEARAEILAAAERQLAAAGPASIRLQAIADELGVTHPAILRHFRTRDELLYALLRHAGRRMREALTAAVADAGEAALDADGFFAALDRIYREEGAARLSAWLLLDGFEPRGSGMFRDAAEKVHRSRRRGTRTRGPALDDTLFALVLLNLVAWGEALVGPALRRAVDLPGDADTSRRFRAWVVALVRSHLDAA